MIGVCCLGANWYWPDRTSPKNCGWLPVHFNSHRLLLKIGWGFPIKVGRHIYLIIYTHGCPKIIVSDQGREFVVKYVRFNNAIVVNTIQELFLSAWNIFFFTVTDFISAQHQPLQYFGYSKKCDSCLSSPNQWSGWEHIVKHNYLLLYYFILVVICSVLQKT